MKQNGNFYLGVGNNYFIKPETSWTKKYLINLTESNFQLIGAGVKQHADFSEQDADIQWGFSAILQVLILMGIP
ncbi:MAG: hypothetical protein O4861_16355 [Trichodesmium sp. St16_bin4-tuft]|nr:hypothetical protein [Trichodesmium sp. MAG_R01]MDE5074317.1 hypothetical protein [Trichodesmium sp. St5_bin8]MDE5099817.1 hypothetical protein [Trichodesmium sp. St16_bin4-tuft]MDE5104048.1 hypothetical protein [Trichodesmium sp. St19_bin2]